MSQRGKEPFPRNERLSAGEPVQALDLGYRASSAGIANKIKALPKSDHLVSCRTVSQTFPSCFNGLQFVPATPCDMAATRKRSKCPQATN